MTRLRSILGSALFLALAPGTVAGLIPYLLTRWRVEAPLFGMEASRIPGGPLIAIGLYILLESFALFAFLGRGTPAPAAPTVQLVVAGFYRHVRNPMYAAVTALNIGQAFLFGSTLLVIYATAVWLTFHCFVYFHEEPALRRLFGAEYEAYARHVPRWLPRLTPWRGQI